PGAFHPGRHGPLGRRHVARCALGLAGGERGGGGEQAQDCDRLHMVLPRSRRRKPPVRFGRTCREDRSKARYAAWRMIIIPLKAKTPAAWRGRWRRQKSRAATSVMVGGPAMTEDGVAGGSANQDILELPRILRVEVFREEARAAVERGPIGVVTFDRAEI